MSKKLKVLGKAEITMALQNAKVPVGPVNSVKHALTHPQALSREVVKLAQGEPFIRTPILFKDFELNYEKGSPELGSSTETIKRKISINEIWEN